MNLNSIIRGVAHRVCPLFDPLDELSSADRQLLEELQDKVEIHALREQITLAGHPSLTSDDL